MELVWVIIIMGIVFVAAVPLWLSAVESRKVDSALNQMVADLRRAHTNATNRLQNWQVDPKPPGEAINSYRVGACGDPCGGAPLATPLLYLDECGADCPPSTIFSSPTGVKVVFHPDGGAQFFGGAGNIVQVAAADGSPCRRIEINPVTSRIEVLPNDPNNPNVCP
jgi:Tfp pilus assembly protein FimT